MTSPPLPVGIPPLPVWFFTFLFGLCIFQIARWCVQYIRAYLSTIHISFGRQPPVAQPLRRDNDDDEEYEAPPRSPRNKKRY